MSRILGYCLTIHAADTWADFTIAARCCLTVSERAALAFAALSALDHDSAVSTAAAACGASGAPLPAFLRRMDDARDWASLASRNELKAYAAAAFDAMSRADQAAFFRRISEVELAA